MVVRRLQTWSLHNMNMESSTGRVAAPVQAVVSWPPPCVAVLKKKPPVLPTSRPCCHSCPVLSQNALNCAGGDPYLHRYVLESACG